VRTRRGSRLDDALRNAVVAFEADDVDLSAHTGWSVAATGLATEVCDSAELDDALHEPVDRWTPSPGDALIAISTEVLTGRRIITGSQPTCT
jgi:hypothetical protein